MRPELQTSASRWRFALAGVLGYAVVGVTFHYALLNGGVEGTANLLLVSCLLGPFVITVLVGVRCGWSTEYTRARWPSRWDLALLYTPPTAGAVVILLSQRDISIGTWVQVVVVVAATYVFGFRIASDNRGAHVRRPIRLDEPHAAHAQIADCRRELRDPSLSTDQRASVELNLAAALITASRGDRDAGQSEAYDLLTRSVRSSDPIRTYFGAMLIVEAMVVKAQRSGDLEGYEETLELLIEAAMEASSERPEAPDEALSARALCFAQLAWMARSNEDIERAERMCSNAAVDVDRLIANSCEESVTQAAHVITRAWLNALDPSGGDLDDAIEKCQQALRVLNSLGNRPQRSEAYIALAQLLTLRAMRDTPEAPYGRSASTRDLSEALRLCERVRGHHAPQARLLIAQIKYALGRLRPGSMRRGWRGIGRLLEATAEEQERLFTGATAAQLEIWALAASEHGTADEAAEAHWRWLRAAVAESRRHVFQEDKQRRLSRVQGLAARTGYWLLAAGRAQDAVLAFELGRAVLLTERMHRHRAGLEERLTQLGRNDLAERWRDASGRAACADRDAFDPRREPPSQGMIDLRGHLFAATFSSAAREAYAD